ncbi:MAG TPA: signal peptidase II, partial [Bacillota bacterium]|nr:signal peptidase II [Bacillota bacterium]
MYGWLMKALALLVAADQASKFVAEALIRPYTTVATPLGRLLRFTLIYNEGAAFGIMSGKRLFIMGVT